jgi:hypothetical protein
MGDNPFASSAEDPFSDPSVQSASSADAEYNPFEHGTAAVAAKPKASSPRTNNTNAYQSEAKASNSASSYGSASSASSSSSAQAAQPNNGAMAAFPGASDEELRLREENLKRREAKLLERERTIEDREGEIRRGGGQADNWPWKCYAMAYHDIDAEIPEHRRGLVRKLYVVVLFSWLCLFWNWFVIIVVYLSPGNLDVSELALWSSIYLVTGVPGSWKLWSFHLLCLSRQCLFEMGVLLHQSTGAYGLLYCDGPWSALDRWRWVIFHV